MNLNRSDRLPEWATVTSEPRNIWQKIAARTKGVITPANTMDAASVLLYANALVDYRKGKRGVAAAKGLVSFMVDPLEGWVANKTGTKSPLGEAVDVLGDKLRLFATIVASHNDEALPNATRVVLVGRMVGMAAVTANGRRNGVRMQPSELNKKAVVIEGLALASYFVGAACETDEGATKASLALRMLGHASTVGLAAVSVASIMQEFDASQAELTEENAALPLSALFIGEHDPAY